MRRKFEFHAFAASDVGKRQSNEDAYLVDEKLGLFVVADGMGGHEKGEVASWFTSKNLRRIIDSIPRRHEEDTFTHGLSAHDFMFNDDTLIEYAILYTNKKICDENEKAGVKAQFNDPAMEEFNKAMRAKSRMGTTLVSMIFRGERAWLTHIGDSRAYRVDATSVTRLTHDHSWIEERIRKGEINADETLTHKKRNVITRSIGFKEGLDVDIGTLVINPPERYLLCSDGLSNVLEEADMHSLCKANDAKMACEQLVATAKLRGGKDNITALLIDVTEVTQEPKGENVESRDSRDDTIF